MNIKILLSTLFIFYLSGVNIVSASTTWHVDDDLKDYPQAQFTSIQDAIDAANSGDTILVHSGIYYENVVINKQLYLKGEHSVVDAKKSGNVIEIKANGVTIEGFTITNSGDGGAGVHLKSSSNCNIRGNIIENNWAGIVLSDGSQNNLITNNKIKNNEKYAMRLLYPKSWNNKIYLNNFINNGQVHIDPNCSPNNDWESSESVTYEYKGSIFTSRMGNYWHHYTGSDNNGDGIGDTKHKVDPSLTINVDWDYYPLMQPFEFYILKPDAEMLEEDVKQSISKITATPSVHYTIVVTPVVTTPTPEITPSTTEMSEESLENASVLQSTPETYSNSHLIIGIILLFVLVVAILLAGVLPFRSQKLEEEKARGWDELGTDETKTYLSNNFATMSPRQFEKFVAKLFNKMGYETKVTPGSGDYGADIIAKKDNETVIIEVKKYAEGRNVSPKEVQRTLGAMWKYKANKAVFITTSDFTVGAREIEKDAPIELWNKEILHQMVRKYFIKTEEQI